MKIDNLFDNIVGQWASKRQLGFLLQVHQKTRLLDHLAIIGGSGQGKTTIAEAIGRGLFEYDDNGKVVLHKNTKTSKLVPKIRAFHAVNCATLTTFSAFVNQWIIPHIQDRQVTIFFDVI